MKRTLPLLLLALLATPAAWAQCPFQSGDCPGPTTTTYCIVNSSPTFVEAEFTFYEGSTLNMNRSFTIGDPVTIVETELCLLADENREAQAQSLAEEDICNPNIPSPETIIPAFPEIVTPVAMGNEAATVETARQRILHRIMVAELWPEDTLLVADCLLGLWDYVDANTNTPQRRTWWNATTSQDSQANSRFNNLGAITSAITIDRANWAGSSWENQ